MKAQNIRLFDVFVLGPFMVWAGFQLKDRLASTAMIAAGAATVVYNGRNYLEMAEAQKVLEVPNG